MKDLRRKLFRIRHNTDLLGSSSNGLGGGSDLG